jgi:hypothetical protein
MQTKRASRNKQCKDERKEPIGKNKRCIFPKRQNKRTKRLANITPITFDLPITDDELNNIIRDLNENKNIDSANENMGLNDKQKKEIKKLIPALKKLKYNPNYNDCFGNKTSNIVDMVASKLQCYVKYGDNIIDNNNDRFFD